MTEHTQKTIQTKKALTVNEASEYTGIGRNNLRKLITMAEDSGHKDWK